MINTQHKLSVRRQCEELDLHRSYAQYEPQPQGDDTTMAKSDRRDLSAVSGVWISPYHSAAASDLWPSGEPQKGFEDHAGMGLQAIYSKPCTTQRNLEHSIYPYLLRDMNITYPHQVWQTDITYVRTPHGFICTSMHLLMCIVEQLWDGA